MSDLATAIFHKQVGDLNFHQPFSCYYKRNDQPSELATLILSTFATKNRSNFEYFKCIILRFIKTNFFPHRQPHVNYVKCKMSLNNLTSSYQNVSIIQIEFCFPKLYFRKFIRTQMECIS